MILEKSTRMPNRFSIPTMYLPVAIKILRTVANLYNLNGLLFQRLATTPKTNYYSTFSFVYRTVLKTQP